MKVTQRTVAAALVAGLLVAAACGDDDSTSTKAKDKTKPTTPPSSVIDPGDGGKYAPQLNPADFVATIDNPYLPWKPGTRWTFTGKDDGEVENTEVVVTDQHKEILGIQTTVVRDTVKNADGDVVEDTHDWYAQDKEGNVWYLGEQTAEYDHGKVTSRHGSWEAGVDNAYGGIVMPAHPTPGKAYRQEYRKGQAEDMAVVLTVGSGSETVKAGTYKNVLVTKEWNPLEPKVIEQKTYAPGVGIILETKEAGGTGRDELVSMS